MINRIAMRLAMARAMYKVADYGANGVYEKEALLTPNIVNKLYELTWNKIFNEAYVVQTLRKQVDDKLKLLNSQHGKGNDPNWLPPRTQGYELMKALLIHDKKFTTDLITAISKDNNVKDIPIIVLKDNYKPQYNYLTTFCMSRDGIIWNEVDIRKNLRKMHPEKDVDNEMILTYDREQEDNDVQKVKGQIALFKAFTENVWNYIATKFNSDGNLGNNAVAMLYRETHGGTYSKIDGEKLTVEQIYNADWSEYYKDLAEIEKNKQLKVKFSQALPEQIWEYYKNKFTYDPTAKYTDSEIKKIEECCTRIPKRHGPYNTLCNDWLSRSNFDDIALKFAIIDYLTRKGKEKDLEKFNKEFESRDFQELLRDDSSVLNKTLKEALYDKFVEMQNNAKAFIREYYKHNPKEKKNTYVDPRTGRVINMDSLGIETQEDIQEYSGAHKIIDYYNKEINKQKGTVNYQKETFDPFEHYL